jgi:hypothetical protein
MMNWARNEVDGKIPTNNFVGILGNQLINNAAALSQPPKHVTSLCASNKFSPSQQKSALVPNTSITVSSFSVEKRIE